MKHLALAVSDQERSRRFYETYFGFDAEPAREYDGGVVMLYNADGFSLALGPTEERIALPSFLHFGIHLSSAEQVREFRTRLAAGGVDPPGQSRAACGHSRPRRSVPGG